MFFYPPIVAEMSQMIFRCIIYVLRTASLDETYLRSILFYSPLIRIRYERPGRGASNG